MRERAAQALNPEMGRMGAEDPPTAFPAAPLAGQRRRSATSAATMLANASKLEST